MYIHFRTIILLTLAMLCATACDNEDSAVTTGSGYLSIAVEPQMLAGQETGDEIALPGIDIPAGDDFTLSLRDADGHYGKTWEKAGDFIQNDRYYSGSYTARATYGMNTREGFNAPTFDGSETFTIADNALVTATIRPKLVNAVFTVDFGDATGDLGLSLSTSEGLDYRFTPATGELLFLEAADVNASLTVSSTSGETISLPMTTLKDIKPGYFYRLTLTSSADNEGNRTVTLGFANAPARKAETMTITEAILHATPPTVTIAGANPAAALDLVEGDTPKPAVAAYVSGIKAGNRVELTTSSPSLRTKGFPAKVDLLHPSDALNAAIALGLKVSRTSDATLTVDFSELLGNLIFTSADEALSRFSVKGIASNAVASLPKEFAVRTLPAEIEVTGTPEALVGTEHAHLTVKSDTPRLAANIAVSISADDGKTWTDAQIESVTRRESGLYDVFFKIPAGSAPVIARILYCEEVRTTVTIERRSPEFELDVDPFATRALVRVRGKNPEMTAIVAEYLNITVDGKAASVYSRDTEKGIIRIIGLAPDSRVTLSASVVEPTEGYDPSKTVTFRTESAYDVPNGDFEDFKESIKYYDLPQGGRYAQYTVEIYNRQHTRSYKVNIPTKGWANVNDKTFCRSARNPNTWYMQPSAMTVDVDQAYSGGYAVELVSTAWDVNGPVIPDYLPPGPPFPDYSMIIPEIANRAAGKLFLGSYSFNSSDLTEVYNEGIDWSTRPSALNGFYRYEPSAANRADYGIAEVELLGKDADGREITIARSRGELHIATGYTSFSLPLTYDRFGVRATRLKIMFSSSASPGTIDHERTSVATFPSPETSTSLGSRLWIDKLEFAY